MKYWSEKLNDKFDTEAALVEAEAAYDEKQRVEAEKANNISKQKKQMSEEITACDKAVQDAIDNLNKVKEDCAKILEESNRQVEDLLKAAKEELSKAREKKYNKIVEWNNKFGPYTVKYTGEKAKTEFDRIEKELKTALSAFPFSSFFKSIW